MSAVAEVPQHMVALELANATRLAGVAVKREVSTGVLSVAAALVDERARTLRVFDVLKAQRRWGKKRAEDTLQAVQIPYGKRVAALTPRQVARLVEHLAPPAREPEPEPEPEPAPPPPSSADDAFICHVLIGHGGRTRTEIEMALRDHMHRVVDLDGALERMTVSGAVWCDTGAGFALYGVDPRFVEEA